MFNLLLLSYATGHSAWRPGMVELSMLTSDASESVTDQI